MCHIRAQSAGGPRYDANQNDEERHGLDNLVLMCASHHAVIDDRANLDTYTVEYLVRIKKDHEEAASANSENAPPVSQAIINALAISTMTYETGAVHNDFRYANFKVGGDGGGPLGAGGQGGVLIISGVAKLPDDVDIDLNGGNGQSPGGGGGGGGVLKFEGREVTASDIRNGLAVRSFTAVNSARIAENLLYILGGGYSHFWVPEVPSSATIAIAYILDLGQIAPDTLLKMEISIEDPDGASTVVRADDIRVGAVTEQVRRCSFAADFQVNVQQYGVHILRLGSAGMVLADYPIEFRPST
ncbi:hypothetical protein C5E44_31075 [Nocardia nova]|nr:hypothetical protein C5E44_31075 [Nocardia nova]